MPELREGCSVNTVNFQLNFCLSMMPQYDNIQPLQFKTKFNKNKIKGATDDILNCTVRSLSRVVLEPGNLPSINQ